MIVSQVLRIVSTVLFAIMFAYRVVYMAISVFVKQKPLRKKVKYRKYAVISCARNEEEVIGQLLESIKAQTYPSEYIDMFVIADNCTDNTALVARREGAIVYERYNKEKVGKGYALDAVLNHMMEDGYDDYDGYFIFDSDNILSSDYIDKMNRFYDARYDAISSNRQSKNFSDSWISAGYSLTYQREMRLLNYPRQIVGSCASITGTGFMLLPHTVKEMHGWKFFLLTEDNEFFADRILKGRRIGYCSDAVFYDEQPAEYGQSWTQRMRWAKGYLQVLLSKGPAMLKKIFSRHGFWAWDFLCCMIPSVLFVVMTFIADILEFASRLIHHMNMIPLINGILQNGLLMYAGVFAMGVLITVLEWKRIKAPVKDKLLFLITFPVFMFTFVPTSVAAVFKRVEWDPIKHSKAESVEDFK